MAYAFRSLGQYAGRTVFHLRVLPREGRFHHANVIRQFYIRRTLPLTLQGCLMRRRNAADVWSIRQCLYARYIHRTQVRLPGIFAGNVALLTGLRLINRAYRKGTALSCKPHPFRMNGWGC